MFPCAILAGGFGTRVYSTDIPKSLIPVAGKPFIHHQLQLLADNGFEHIVICTGFLGGDVAASVGTSFGGMKISYSHDGQEPLGTGGALRKASPLLGPDFFVIYGDSYLDCDYGAIQSAYEQAGHLGLLTVCAAPNGYEPNVHYDPPVVVRYSKRIRDPLMRYIDYGLCVLDRGAFALLEDDPCGLGDLYRVLANGSELAGYDVGQPFHEIGSLAGLEETRRFLRCLQQPT